MEFIIPKKQTDGKKKDGTIMQHLIELNNVFKIYQTGAEQVRALDGVTLTVDAGEYVAIMGQSGSGKSTLMNIMGCLDIPTKGEYHLEEQDVLRLSDARLSDIRNREIGFVFQSFHLISGLDALENVEMPLIYQGMGRKARRRIAMESLKKVGLEQRIHHRPCEMSGGQQQRVAIARAIAAHPPLILADEPTGNLDSHSRADIMQILQGLNRAGHTVVMITHDAQIAACAQRVVSMQDGRIVSDVQR